MSDPDGTATVGPSPRFTPRPADDPTYRVDPGHGWVLFAGIMLAVVGVLNVAYGIAADLFATGNGFVQFFVLPSYPLWALAEFAIVGDDGSGRNRKDQSIAADNRTAFAADIDAVATVNENELGFHRQRRNGRGRRHRRAGPLFDDDPGAHRPLELGLQLPYQIVEIGLRAHRGSFCFATRST